MPGLNKYIAKYGRHFTEELVTKAIECRLSPTTIERISDPMVYYNVSKATLGDIVYLVNYYYLECTSRAKCIKHALRVVEDVDAEGYAFDLWYSKNKEFDFTLYI